VVGVGVDEFGTHHPWCPQSRTFTNATEPANQGIREAYIDP
jgi:hypothetical protein